MPEHYKWFVQLMGSLKNYGKCVLRKNQMDFYIFRTKKNLVFIISFGTALMFLPARSGLQLCLALPGQVGTGRGCWKDLWAGLGSDPE